MSRLKMLYIRLFKVISIEQAIKYKLTFHRNIHGDEINHINCRSIWIDKHFRTYRVNELKKSK